MNAADPSLTNLKHGEVRCNVSTPRRWSREAVRDPVRGLSRCILGSVFTTPLTHLSSSIVYITHSLLRSV